MEGSIQLSVKERKALLLVYRSAQEAGVSRRVHILLLLDDGWSYRDVRAITYASFDLIAACVQSFRREGLSAFTATSQEQEKPIPSWLNHVARWLSRKTPEAFGYFRTRWSCATLAEVLAWETGIRLSAETVRRGLHRLNFVWRRPRPVLGPHDPHYRRKLRKIQGLLRALPANEVAVFQDEVDIHLNPKVGACWMERGQQAEVVTPGQNVKRHLAGSLVWRTGTLLVSPAGTSRNAELFVAHLDDLRRRLRSFAVIHVICDNAKFHDCRRVQAYLKQWGHRVRLHYLPTYAPETNPIERIWWRLHETLTRNHRCQNIEELLAQIYSWIDTHSCFYTRTLADYAKAA